MRSFSLRTVVRLTGLQFLTLGTIVFNDGLQAQVAPKQVHAAEQPAKLKERHALVHSHAVTAVAAGPNFVATGDLIGALRLWDFKTGQLKEVVFEGQSTEPPPPSIKVLQLNRADSKLFVVTKAGENIFQCDVAKKGRNSPGGGWEGARAFGATPDGKLWAVILGDKTSINFLENSFDENIVPFMTLSRISLDNEVIQLAFAADSKRFSAITSDGKIHLGDIAEKAVSWSASLKDIDPTLAAFSPDGLKIAIAGKKGAIRLLDAARGKSITIFAAHEKPVTAIVWRADNQQLVTASQDGTVRIWDTLSGKRLAEAKGHTAAVRCVAISGDDKFLLSGGDDKTLRIWELTK